MEPRQQEQLAPTGEIQSTASQYEAGAAQNSPEVAQSGVENRREIGSVRAEAVQAAMAAAPALPTPVLSAQSDNNAGAVDDTRRARATLSLNIPFLLADRACMFGAMRHESSAPSGIGGRGAERRVPCEDTPEPRWCRSCSQNSTE